MMPHNLFHVTPYPDSQGGFVWNCTCGEEDSVWDDATGAAAGLTQRIYSEGISGSSCLA